MKHLLVVGSFIAPLLVVAASAAQPAPPPPPAMQPPPPAMQPPQPPQPPSPQAGPGAVPPMPPPGMEMHEPHHRPMMPGGPPMMHRPEPRRLLATGVTLGLGLGIEFGKFLPNSAVSQDHPQVTAMPYLVLAPAYWFSTRAMGTYCAAAGTVPTDVADALAKEAGAERRSGCAAHMFGLYLARPFAYDAKTTLTLGIPKTRVREVDPHVSFGVAFLPVSPISVLLGFTLSDVSRDDGTAARLVTPHLAVGLNFDAVTMIGSR